MKKLLILALVSRFTFAQVLVGSGSSAVDPDNSLSNPGVESGNQGFTISGYTAKTNGSISAGDAGYSTGVYYQGSRSMAMYGNVASTQYIEVTQSLSGKFGNLANVPVRCEFMWRYPAGSSGDYQLQLLQGGSSIISAVRLPVTGSAWARQWVTQIAGSSGNLSCRIVNTSTSSNVAYADRFYLGQNKQDFFVPNAELIGSASIPGTGSCTWARTSATYGLFSSTAACPAPTVDFNGTGPEVIQTTDSDFPRFTINNLRPGRYQIIISTSFQSSAGAAVSIGLSDDGGTTTKCKTGQAVGVGSVPTPVTIHCEFQYTTSGNKTFDIVGYASSGTVTIVNNQTGFDTVFGITRFPLGSEYLYNSNDANWYVDSNIVGANISLGTSAVTSYTEITNGSLTLTNNSGSQTAQIACASGTASTGTTCSSNESLGIAFSIPTTGTYLACADFTWQGNVTGVSAFVSTAFELIETSNTSSSIVQEGKARINSIVSTNLVSSTVATAYPYRLCGVFVFSTIGQKTIRLQYEQAVGGSVTSSSVFLDGDTSTGQRDMHFTVFPINQNKTVLLNQNNKAARVKTSTAQSFSSGVEATVNWDASDYDTDSAFDLSSDQYTCPVTGKYAVMGQVTWAASTGTGAAQVNVYQNAVQITAIPVQKLSSTSAKTAVPFDTELSCTAGQTIQVKGTQNLGTVALSADNKESFVSIRYLGQ